MNPIVTSDRFGPIADSDDQAIEIPIADFIAKRKKKLRNKTKHKKTFAPTSCHSSCSCPSHTTARTFEIPAAPTLVDPSTELSAAWARHRAIRNFEKFQKESFGKELDMQTDINVIASTSLGIEGWALYDVGDQKSEDGDSWDSEVELTDLESFSGRDSDGAQGGEIGDDDGDGSLEEQ